MFKFTLLSLVALIAVAFAADCFTMNQIFGEEGTAAIVPAPHPTGDTICPAFNGVDSCCSADHLVLVNQTANTLVEASVLVQNSLVIVSEALSTVLDLVVDMYETQILPAMNDGTLGFTWDCAGMLDMAVNGSTGVTDIDELTSYFSDAVMACIMEKDAVAFLNTVKTTILDGFLKKLATEFATVFGKAAHAVTATMCSFCDPALNFPLLSNETHEYDETHYDEQTGEEYVTHYVDTEIVYAATFGDGMLVAIDALNAIKDAFDFVVAESTTFATEFTKYATDALAAYTEKVTKHKEIIAQMAADMVPPATEIDSITNDEIMTGAVMGAFMLFDSVTMLQAKLEQAGVLNEYVAEGCAPFTSALIKQSFTLLLAFAPMELPIQLTPPELTDKETQDLALHPKCATIIADLIAQLTPDVNSLAGFEGLKPMAAVEAIEAEGYSSTVTVTHTSFEAKVVPEAECAEGCTSVTKSAEGSAAEDIDKEIEENIPLEGVFGWTALLGAAIAAFVALW